MKNSFYYVLVVVISLSSVLACEPSNGNEDINRDTNTPADTTQWSGFTVQKLYDQFRNPWGMAWLPDGRLLITERSGEILVFKDDKFTGEKLSGVPAVFNKGQGGLMDIQLHPNYAQNKWIYITYSKPGPGGAATAVMRFKLEGNQMVEQQDIFVAKPYLPADFHFGSRVVFDKNGFLYVSVGERGTQPKVQQLDNDHGKIHRIYDDGRVPADNPFAGQKDAKASIWTYGHRNPQGMVYDAANDRIWEIEHGPKGGDELNLIQKGKNYGWPKTSYGINYDGTILTEYKEMEGVENPVRYWVPSIAPCGMMLVTSKRYPEWKGNLLIGALSFRLIARVELSGTKFVKEEDLIKDMARVRHVAQSPDGYIYAITEGPGLLLKLAPNK
ncbi:PQQ-dependent sugar dehydrogenase [Chitinophagaceae bacterium LB-8]|uniref:PQQ-dependent sugar dehydrogenase n=1 Tax=Paraflavisolibacter caeni TaxID=2982496 RepID=A0A9X2XUV2_9BACT|nr:PQQ-dependent sugar dehydrogenase [Paraflavisolibacter caeni]MCU7548208.1 PQQ-dependent sugar dehydrogenase [Paraflavisolibacter caeni]